MVEFFFHFACNWPKWGAQLYIFSHILDFSSTLFVLRIVTPSSDSFQINFVVSIGKSFSSSINAVPSLHITNFFDPISCLIIR